MRLSTAAILATLLVCPNAQSQTAPGELRPLRIYGLGDMGEPGPLLKRSVELLSASVSRESSPDDVVVYLGDNFYPDGLQTGHRDRINARIRGVMDESGLRTAQSLFAPGHVLAVPGNHEYYDHLLFGHLPIGFSESGDGVRARAGELGWRYAGGRADAVYLQAPDGARVAVFLMDSGVGVAGSKARIDELMNELEGLLKASIGRADWRILAMHHPLETRGDHGHSFDNKEEHGWFRRHSFPHKLDTCSRTFQRFSSRLAAVINTSGVAIDAVLSGHDHDLQVLSLASKHALYPRVQIVSGSSSKVHGRTRRVGAHEFLASVPGFVALEVTKAQIGIVFHSDAPPCLAGTTTRYAAFELPSSGPLVGTSPCRLGLP